MSVFLNDLSDFIIPSQACVNPFVLAREDNKDGGGGGGGMGNSTAAKGMVDITKATENNKMDSNSSSTSINSSRPQSSSTSSTSTSNSGGSSAGASNPVKYLKLSLEDDVVSSFFPRSAQKGVKSSIPSKPNLMMESESRVDGSDKKVAKVSLSDCLACSGCVTTAETLLIEDQSYLKLLKVIEEGKFSSPEAVNYRVVISFSLQSLASISSMANIPINELFSRLAVLLKKSLGASYVIDMSNVQELCLLETCHEFIHRLKYKPTSNNNSSSSSSNSNSSNSSSSSNSNSSRGLPSVAPSIAVSSTSIRYVTSSTDIYSNGGGGTIGGSEILDIGYPSLSDQNLPTPFFVSHCPGWICYVEKSLNSSSSAIMSNSSSSKSNSSLVNNPYNPLSHVSTTKSAQQILGSIFKKIIPVHEDALLSSSSSTASSSTSSMPPSPLSSSSSTSRPFFLVSVQPCFDKKLEASRKDFYHEDINQNDIDLVISTTEFWNLLEHIMSPPSAAAASMSEDSNSSDATSASSCDKGKTVDKVTDFIKSFDPEDTAVDSDPIERLFRSEGNALFNADASRTSAGVPSSNLDQVAAISSGSFLEFVYRYISSNFGSFQGIEASPSSSMNASGDVWTRQLTYTGGRNVDISEVELSLCGHAFGGPSRQLKFVRAYGFRNIQSLLMKLKKAKVDFDFVEIMACPSGCVNGGGQLKLSNADAGDTRESPQTVKARVSGVTSALLEHKSNQPPSSISLSEGSNNDAGRSPNPFVNNSLIQFIFSDAVTGGPMSDRAVSLLHTRYHVVPKLDIIAPQASKW